MKKKETPIEIIKKMRRAYFICYVLMLFLPKKWIKERMHLEHGMCWWVKNLTKHWCLYEFSGMKVVMDLLIETNKRYGIIQEFRATDDSDVYGKYWFEKGNVEIRLAFLNSILKCIKK